MILKLLLKLVMTLAALASALPEGLVAATTGGPITDDTYFYGQSEPVYPSRKWPYPRGDLPDAVQRS